LEWAHDNLKFKENGFPQHPLPLFRRWVGRNVSQPAAIDDIVQEVMAALVEGLPRFQHNLRPGAFRSWLESTTIHRIRRHWRAEPRVPGQIEELEHFD
jgi:DNA-directed RNA polymerase specialized sigma24 family protein